MVDLLFAGALAIGLGNFVGLEPQVLANSQEGNPNAIENLGNKEEQ